MTNIIIALFTGAIIAWISSYFAHIYSVSRDRRKDFNNAAKNFRSCFLHELKMLKRHDKIMDAGNITEHILAAAIDGHETAMLNFRQYLTEINKTRFDEAWRNYALIDDDAGWHTSPNEAIHKYYSYDNKILELKMRELAIKSIEWLFTFAKPI